jgi:hypothetical protein
LRISMEEQRRVQEAETVRNTNNDGNQQNASTSSI